MNPSTYKQVEENAKQVDIILRNIGDLSGLPMTVQEMAAAITALQDTVLTPGAGSDLAVDVNNNSKVLGLHVNTANSTTDLTPDKYSSGCTVELKRTTTIAANSLAGVTDAYCFLITFKQDSNTTDETTIDLTGGYHPTQLIIANNSFFIYKRIALSNVWGEWTGRPVQNPQFVTTPDSTAPTNQASGEFWVETIT